MPFNVSVQKEVKGDSIPADEQLIAWAKATQQDPLVMLELNIRIVSPNEMQNLNKLYRGQDKITNVLSFTSSLPEGVLDTHLLGDVVICAEQVELEAREFNKSIEARWAHMVVHGCLHVQGFDHEEADERDFMEAEEQKILKILQFSDPYLV